MIAIVVDPWSHRDRSPLRSAGDRHYFRQMARAVTGKEGAVKLIFKGRRKHPKGIEELRITANVLRQIEKGADVVLLVPPKNRGRRSILEGMQELLETMMKHTTSPVVPVRICGS